MTTQPLSPSTQRVIIAGTIDLQRRRTDRRKTESVPVVQRRNGARAGKLDQVLIQVRSPYGESFALSVDVPAGIPGAEMLYEATEDTLLVFEGELQTRDVEQRQYATGPTDGGRHVQQLVLVPTSVRQPVEGEAMSFSACWLTGTVVEPPRLIRHPAVPAIQLVLTRLRLTGTRAATGNPYISGPVSPQEITVAVPLLDDNAAVVYKPGNIVQVAGQMECIEEEQRGPQVSAAVTALDTAWAEDAEARAQLNVEERRQQERRYRIGRARLVQGTRTMVLASEVTLEQGELITLDESQDLRRVYQAEARARRQRRQQSQREYNKQVRDNGGTTRNMEANRAFLAQAEALMPEGDGGGQRQRRRRAQQPVDAPIESVEGAVEGANGHSDESVADTVVLAIVE